MKEKNNLMVFREGNFIKMERRIVEKLDAEEFTRALAGMEEQYTFMQKQMNGIKVDIDKMKKWEQVAIDMREKEVTQAKEERSKYIG